LFACVSLLSESTYEIEDLNFVHNNEKIQGKLIVPLIKKQKQNLVIFVHGDGAINYDAYGYYDSLFSKLAKNSIISYSWNKKGVEESQGNWLNQSMQDRADELSSLLKMLKSNKEFTFNKIIILGFSQASWPISLFAKDNKDIDNFILVSPAINWLQQSVYMSEKRLLKEGFSKKEISLQIKKDLINSKRIFSSTYQEYLKIKEKNSISEDRFNFIKLNYKSDMTKNIKYLNKNLLSIFASDDENIDINESIRVLKKELLMPNNFSLKVFDKAQHSLLKNEYFENTKYDLWFLFKLNILGEDAFVDGYEELIIDWIKNEA